MYKLNIDGKLIPIKYCRDTWSLIRGLMFSKKAIAVLDLGKERYVRIHNWFVFYTLDIYYFYKGRVSKIRLRPFGIAKPRRAKIIVEIPSSMGIKLKKIKPLLSRLMRVMRQ